jgi:hypothetical protein
MEKLLLLAVWTAAPAMLFILNSKFTGQYRVLAGFVLKIPSFISLVCLVVLTIHYLGIIKLN